MQDNLIFVYSHKNAYGGGVQSSFRNGQWLHGQPRFYIANEPQERSMVCSAIPGAFLLCKRKGGVKDEKIYFA